MTEIMLLMTIASWCGNPDVIYSDNNSIQQCREQAIKCVVQGRPYKDVVMCIEKIKVSK